MMLSEEIYALRRFGKFDIMGERITYAYGRFYDWSIPVDMEYDFEIMLDGGVLYCSIDVYSAIGYPPGEFDVDAWTDQQINLNAPATRADYYALRGIARSILKGYRVVLRDGETIHIPELKKC